MILSFAHHASHAHHLGRVVAAVSLAAAGTVGIVESQTPDPATRVTVSRVVEAPATDAPTSTASPVAPAASGSESTTGIAVTVPTREEILAQCAAAGLTAECVSAGLR